MNALLFVVSSRQARYIPIVALTLVCLIFVATFKVEKSQVNDVGFFTFDGDFVDFLYSRDSKSWLLVSIFSTFPLTLEVILDLLYRQQKGARRNSGTFIHLTASIAVLLSLLVPCTALYVAVTSGASVHRVTACRLFLWMQLVMGDIQGAVVLIANFAQMGVGQKTVRSRHAHSPLFDEGAQATLWQILSLIAQCLFLVDSPAAPMIAVFALLLLIMVLVRVTFRRIFRWMRKSENISNMLDVRNTLQLSVLLAVTIGRFSMYIYAMTQASGFLTSTSTYRLSAEDFYAFLSFQIVISATFAVIPGRCWRQLALIRYNDLENGLFVIWYASEEMYISLHSALVGMMVLDRELKAIDAALLCNAEPDTGEGDMTADTASAAIEDHSKSRPGGSQLQRLHFKEDCGEATFLISERAAPASTHITVQDLRMRNRRSLDSPALAIDEISIDGSEDSGKRDDVPDAAPTSVTTAGAAAVAAEAAPMLEDSVSEQRSTTSSSMDTRSPAARASTATATTTAAAAEVTQVPSLRSTAHRSSPQRSKKMRKMQKEEMVWLVQLAYMLRTLHHARMSCSSTHHTLESLMYHNEALELAEVALVQARAQAGVSLEGAIEGNAGLDRRMGLLMKELDGVRVLREAVDPFEVRAREAGVSLVLQLQWEPAPEVAPRASKGPEAAESWWAENYCLYGDAEKLSELMRTLVSSALDSTIRGGSVCIDIRLDTLSSVCTAAPFHRREQTNRVLRANCSTDHRVLRDMEEDSEQAQQSLVVSVCLSADAAFPGSSPVGMLDLVTLSTTAAADATHGRTAHRMDREEVQLHSADTQTQFCICMWIASNIVDIHGGRIWAETGNQQQRSAWREEGREEGAGRGSVAVDFNDSECITFELPVFQKVGSGSNSSVPASGVVPSSTNLTPPCRAQLEALKGRMSTLLSARSRIFSMNASTQAQSVQPFALEANYIGDVNGGGSAGEYGAVHHNPQQQRQQHQHEANSGRTSGVGVGRRIAFGPDEVKIEKVENEYAPRFLQRWQESEGLSEQDLHRSNPSVGVSELNWEAGLRFLLVSGDAPYRVELKTQLLKDSSKHQVQEATDLTDVVQYMMGCINQQTMPDIAIVSEHLDGQAEMEIAYRLRELELRGVVVGVLHSKEAEESEDRDALVMKRRHRFVSRGADFVLSAPFTVRDLRGLA